MQEMFIFGSFWFWTIVAVETVLLFLFIEKKNGTGATISMLIFAAIIQFFGDVDIIGFTTEHPVRAALGILAYFALGTLTAVAKWLLYAKDHIEHVNEVRDEWLKSQGYGWPLVSDDQKSQWKSHKLNHGLQKPLIRQHKSDFIRWMTFWWIILVWSIFADGVKRICKSIYKRISKFLQKMVDDMWRKAGYDPDDED